MTTRKSNAEKAVHFGTISMPIAKGLYTNGNYSLIMILAYLDSRKQKQGDSGYQYPYEYNAPDIHYKAVWNNSWAKMAHFCNAPPASNVCHAVTAGC